ncbi:uncharacterized protein [Palaemon carinicauda]|uniref:uncharacterized protein n=1 Tax=Palaemon carinicauda TaxID=392227 RepID=UPI0035B65A52
MASDPQNPDVFMVVAKTHLATVTKDLYGFIKVRRAFREFVFASAVVRHEPRTLISSSIWGKDLFPSEVVKKVVDNAATENRNLPQKWYYNLQLPTSWYHSKWRHNQQPSLQPLRDSLLPFGRKPGEHLEVSLDAPQKAEAIEEDVVKEANPPDNSKITLPLHSVKGEERDSGICQETSEIRSDIKMPTGESAGRPSVRISDRPSAKSSIKGCNRIFIHKDTSKKGWGGHSHQQKLQGTWSSLFKTFHINNLEAMAVFLTLKKLDLCCSTHIRLVLDSEVDFSNEILNKIPKACGRFTSAAPPRPISWSLDKVIDFASTLNNENCSLKDLTQKSRFGQYTRRSQSENNYFVSEFFQKHGFRTSSLVYWMEVIQSDFQTLRDVSTRDKELARSNDLPQYLRSKYGGPVLSSYRHLESTRKKLRKAQLDLDFLLYCRLSNVVPNFVKFRLYRSSLYSTDFYRESTETLLDLEIKHKERLITKHETTITELYAPVIEVSLGRSLNPDRIKEGDHVYFECAVKSKPPVLTVSWKHNGRPLMSGSPEQVLVANMSLVVQGVTRDHAGNYTCHATNVRNTSSSAPLRLDVKYAPVCASSEKTQYSVAKLENAEIACKVHANPSDVTFKWTFNNTAEAIDVPEGRFVVVKTESRVNYTPMNELDYGTLLCWANNTIGIQEHPCVFHIVAAGKPDPPHNCRVFDVTVSSLQIACSAGDDGGLPQNFSLKVYQIGKLSPIVKVSRLSPSFSISGLRPATAYKITIVAINDKGSSKMTELKAYTITVPETPEETNAEPARDQSQETRVPVAVAVGIAVALVPVLMMLIGVLVKSRFCGACKRRSRNVPELEGPEKASHSMDVVSTLSAEEINPDIISHTAVRDGGEGKNLVGDRNLTDLEYADDAVLLSRQYRICHACLPECLKYHASSYFTLGDSLQAYRPGSRNSYSALQRPVKSLAKRDDQECNNYKGIKLVFHTTEVLERMGDSSIKQEVDEIYERKWNQRWCIWPISATRSMEVSEEEDGPRKVFAIDPRDVLRGVYQSKEHFEMLDVTVVEGGLAALPCDLKVEDPKDSVQLILWIKEGIHTPLYSYDYRELLGGRPKEIRPDSNSTLSRRTTFRTDRSPAALIVERTEAEDAGIYRCRVDFLLSPTVNRRVNLTVIVPPSELRVSWQLGNSGLMEVHNREAGPFLENSQPSLVCFSDDGWPPPSLSWYEGEELLDSSYSHNAIKGQVENEIALPILTRDDLGRRLTCQASNSDKTHPTTITVNIAMTLSIISVEVEPLGVLWAGERADVECHVWGSRPPPSVVWWLGPQMIPTTQSIVLDEGNETISVLNFIPTPRDDGNMLICQATNEKLPDQAVQDSIVLSVNYAPVIEVSLGRSLNPDRIKEGDHVYFECAVKSKPPVLTVSWKHNGRPLMSGSPEQVLVANMSLVVQGVTRDHAGNYTCHATNVRNTSSSAPLRLDVKYAPVCASSEKTQYSVAKLENAEIACKVHANPSDVTFKWTFNNTAEAIDVPEGRFVVVKTESRVNYTPMNELDYGTLLCWANNTIGIQEHPCVFHIVAAGKPDPPHNCRVFDVTVSSLQIACSAGDDGGLPQNFSLKVYQIGKLSPIVKVSRLSPSFSISGLRPATAYKITIVAINDKGSSKMTELKAYTITVPETPEETNAEPARDQSQETRVPVAVAVGIAVALVPVLMMLIGVLVKSRFCGACKRRSRHVPELEGPEKTSHSMDVVSTLSAEEINPDIISHTADPPAWESGQEPSISTIIPTTDQLPNGGSTAFKSAASTSSSGGAQLSLSRVSELKQQPSACMGHHHHHFHDTTCLNTSLHTHTCLTNAAAATPQVPYYTGIQQHQAVEASVPPPESFSLGCVLQPALPTSFNPLVSTLDRKKHHPSTSKLTCPHSENVNLKYVEGGQSQQPHVFFPHLYHQGTTGVCSSCGVASKPPQELHCPLSRIQSSSDQATGRGVQPHHHRSQCSLSHAPGYPGQIPLPVISRASDVELVRPLGDAKNCCGSGRTNSVVLSPPLSRQIKSEDGRKQERLIKDSSLDLCSSTASSSPGHSTKESTV